METIELLNIEIKFSVLDEILQIISPKNQKYTYKRSLGNFFCPLCHKYGSNHVIIICKECDHFYHLDCLGERHKVYNNCNICQKDLPKYPTIRDFYKKLKNIVNLCNDSDWWDKMKELPDENIDIVKREIEDYVDM